MLIGGSVIANAGLVVVLVITPPVVVNVSTLLLPTRLIESFFPAKLATPADAVAVTVPDNVPLPVVNAGVTTRVESAPDVTVLPNWSSIVTTGCCANATPATVLAEGCVVTTNWLAFAAFTVSCCVPLVIPAFAAVSVGVPACVSV